MTTTDGQARAALIARAEQWLDGYEMPATTDTVTAIALIRDLLACVRQGEWQDIATAPKDGTDVLLFAEGEVTFGGWLSAADQGAEPGEEHLITAGWWSVGLCDNQPTHWMPLPEPPR